ncbi:6-hydroxy-D-nicotine oxidase [Penicillium tannophilum]|nr:6-hydroxy-D-nicotine oxidase [Penicillium tannophilum]
MASITTTVIDQLKAVFSSKVVTPDVESEYQAAVAIPWSQTCWTPAAGYVYLSSVQELTEALETVKKTGTKFTIRTTGHNPNIGFSSADETAVVLDIRQFQAKELGPDGVARVGSGNTWGEVYAWLEEQKLSAIGGRDQQVGLGGFLLGGGMGALPNMYGLGVDGVRNFEVLLADGRLVNANAKEHADLYRALKGGGSNFGIVTRFDLETHPLINVQYTINLYNPEDHVEINKATVAVQNAMEDDPKIGLFTNLNNGFVAVGLLYGDISTERPAAFEPFYNLKSLMTTVLPSTNGTLLSLAQAMGHKQEAKKRAICTMTTKVSQELYEDVYKLWTKVCKTLPADAVLHYTIQPFGKAGVQAGKDRGGNIMGHESIPQCWWVFTSEWPQEGSDDHAVRKAVATMAESVESLASEKGLLLDFKCMSFANAYQKVLRSYGAENAERMRETAAKYDPEGVFQKLQHGGFLLRDNI